MFIKFFNKYVFNSYAIKGILELNCFLLIGLIRVAEVSSPLIPKPTFGTPL